MTQSSTGEQKSTESSGEAMTLSEAVRIVREAIEAEETKLKQIAHGPKTDDLVVMEGETSQGCGAHVLVSAEEAAKIMLNHWYPAYEVLGEDAPQEMWDDLARMAGLEDVGSIDL